MRQVSSRISILVMATIGAISIPAHSGANSLILRMGRCRAAVPFQHRHVLGWHTPCRLLGIMSEKAEKACSIVDIAQMDRTITDLVCLVALLVMRLDALERRVSEADSLLYPHPSIWRRP